MCRFLRQSYAAALVASLLTSSALAAPRVFDDLPADPQPIFRPEGRPLQGLTVTIDPGHGGSAHQPGYAGSARGIVTGAVEEDLNMKVAALLRHYLRNGGAQVHLTRLDDRKVVPGESDRATELGARTALAERTQSHIFLALHHNSTGNPGPDGVVIMIDPTDSKGEDQPLERALADIMRSEVQALVHHTQADRNHYINNHPLVSSSDIPSAVVEFGFLSNPNFDRWVTQPYAAQAEARGVYNGLVRMWSEHREALEAKRLELFPDARPSRQEREPDDMFREVNASPTEAPALPPHEQEAASQATSQPSSRPTGRFGGRSGSLARGYWPFENPPTTAREANFILDQWKKSMLSDRTMLLADVRVEDGENGTFVLVGDANHKLLQAAPANLLEGMGLTVENKVRLVPQESLGEKCFGLVQIPMAFTWGSPEEGASPQTELLLGEPVWLLDRTEDGTYYRISGGEGYIGWVREEAILPMTSQEWGAWLDQEMAVVTRDTRAGDFRLPVGSVLPVVASDDEAATVSLRLPRKVRASGSGDTISVPMQDLLLPSTQPIGVTAIQTASKLLGSPYVFGGKTSQGIDCSGLVGIAYASVGLRLPRDANQQAMVGLLVGTPYEKGQLRPGDIVFFMDPNGRVSHTGLSLGGSRFLHASAPEVQVSSFDPEDPFYATHWDERFLLARRPLF